jgi:hypothetical protein
MRWNGLLVLALAGWPGCARNQAANGSSSSSSSAHTGQATKPSAVIVTPAAASSGRITSVNPTARFVVITYPVGVALPAVDRPLSVYRGGLKVAEIRITGPSRDLNTVADITSGECQPGDEAREN